MRAALVHLSDIHLRRSGNPVVDAVDQLANAVNSVDASVTLFLVTISGDVANTGVSTEYQTALRFFRDFETKLRGLRPGAVIKFVSVPGNHDCVLPKGKAKLRQTLVQGVIPSMQELKQDEASIGEVAKVQAHYNRFRKQLQDGANWNGICEKITIEHGGHVIQVNLYNTALDLPPIFSPGIMRLSPVLGSPTLHLQSHSHHRKKRLRPAEPCERSRTEPRSSAQTPRV